MIERTGKSVGVLTVSGSALCCGRTYLAAGLTGKAVDEMTRTTRAFTDAIRAGKKVVGLEPSCTLMFRDEVVNLVPDWSADLGAQILTFAEYVSSHGVPGVSGQGISALVHGHCHQKAMGVAQATVDVLSRVDTVQAEMIDSSCCGMAGSFGYQDETEHVSRDMAELSLAPAVRAAPESTLIVADGFSCRCQIRDVAGRDAVSLAVALDQWVAP